MRQGSCTKTIDHAIVAACRNPVYAQARQNPSMESGAGSRNPTLVGGHHQLLAAGKRRDSFVYESRSW